MTQRDCLIRTLDAPQSSSRQFQSHHGAIEVTWCRAAEIQVSPSVLCSVVQRSIV